MEPIEPAPLGAPIAEDGYPIGKPEVGVPDSTVTGEPIDPTQNPAAENDVDFAFAAQQEVVLAENDAEAEIGFDAPDPEPEPEPEPEVKPSGRLRHIFNLYGVSDRDRVMLSQDSKKLGFVYSDYAAKREFYLEGPEGLKIPEHLNRALKSTEPI